MTFNNSTIVILLVVAFAFYLLYIQNKQPKYIPIPQYKVQNQQAIACPKCVQYRQQLDQLRQTQPQIAKITIDNNNDPYSDPIKKQDLYTMFDPLTYPQLRLPREILEKYNEFYDKNGFYPPFNQSSRPLFDNPILNGILIKQIDENEPFNDNIPSSIPLFRIKSSKNTNRFFYYILDQRYPSKLELKIPLDHIKINGIKYNNADFYGLPEIYDGDIIENIPIYPGAKFKTYLYKVYHFP
jgi:hypothetical protein